MAINKARDSIGIIGLGIMGGAFARNLVKAGWKVTGFDISKEQCAALAKSGVNIAASVAGVVTECPVVMTSLPSLKAIDAVAKEIAVAKAPARIVLEMSTIPLDDKLRFGKAVSASGHTAIDCPVSGTGAQAATGDLSFIPAVTARRSPA